MSDETQSTNSEGGNVQQPSMAIDGPARGIFSDEILHHLKSRIDSFSVSCPKSTQAECDESDLLTDELIAKEVNRDVTFTWSNVYSSTKASLAGNAESHRCFVYSGNDNTVCVTHEYLVKMRYRKHIKSEPYSVYTHITLTQKFTKGSDEKYQFDGGRTSYFSDKIIEPDKDAYMLQYKRDNLWKASFDREPEGNAQQSIDETLKQKSVASVPLPSLLQLADHIDQEGGENKEHKDVSSARQTLHAFLDKEAECKSQLANLVKKKKTFGYRYFHWTGYFRQTDNEFSNYSSLDRKIKEIRNSLTWNKAGLLDKVNKAREIADEHFGANLKNSPVSVAGTNLQQTHDQSDPYTEIRPITSRTELERHRSPSVKFQSDTDSLFSRDSFSADDFSKKPRSASMYSERSFLSQGSGDDSGCYSDSSSSRGYLDTRGSPGSRPSRDATALERAEKMLKSHLLREDRFSWVNNKTKEQAVMSASKKATLWGGDSIFLSNGLANAMDVGLVVPLI